MGMGGACVVDCSFRDALRAAADARGQTARGPAAEGLPADDRDPGGRRVLDRRAGVLQPAAKNPLAGFCDAVRDRRVVAGAVFLAIEIEAAGSVEGSAIGGRAARNRRVLARAF